MRSLRLAVFISLASCLEAVSLQFPDHFKFGAATSAYQIEGGWNASDKSPSMWDEFTHNQGARFAQGENGDVACDSYYRAQRDIEMVAELGLDFYRFSISWPRLLPNGFSNKVSVDGKKYYNDLIDGLLAKGVEPLVTLYHWDLPQRLQNLGGWTNPLVADWFAQYARVVFSLFGDRVKTWVTINEPFSICDVGYSGFIAPGIKDLEVGVYMCTKNVLIAHAKAWRIYDEEFRQKFHGEISLTNEVLWVEAGKKADRHLAKLAMQAIEGRFSHPIFSKEGGWPPEFEKVVAENSRKQGYSKSKLPAFTKAEIELVRGTYDYYGLNHYTSRIVRRKQNIDEKSDWPSSIPDFDGILYARPDWKTTDWIKSYPEGFRHLLAWVKEQYGDVKILVTENGWIIRDTDLEAKDQVEYLKDYITQMLLAINKDGVNVAGYTVWSLMDNYEWNQGYSSKFGLYHVNFSDPHRTRTPRSAAHFYANLIKTRSLHSPPVNSRSYAVWITLAVFLAAGVLCVFLYKCYLLVRNRKRYGMVNTNENNNNLVTSGNL